MLISARKILLAAALTVVAVIGVSTTVSAQLLGGDGGPLDGVTGGHGGGGLLDDITGHHHGGGGGGSGGPVDDITGGGGGGGLLDGVTGGGDGDGGLVPG